MVSETQITVIAAVVTIFSGLGIIGYIRKEIGQFFDSIEQLGERQEEIVRKVREQDRILHGEPAVDGWDGIVSKQQKQQEEIDEIWDRFDPTGGDHDMRTDGAIVAPRCRITTPPPKPKHPEIMVLDWIRNRINEAGAYRESDTERDGFLSYAAESHAIGYGVALGAAVGLSMLGHPEPLAIVIAALGGVGAARKKKNERVWKEIREEFQYFGPSIAVGFLGVVIPALAAGAAVQSPV